MYDSLWWILYSELIQTFQGKAFSLGTGIFHLEYTCKMHRVKYYAIWWQGKIKGNLMLVLIRVKKVNNHTLTTLFWKYSLVHTIMVNTWFLSLYRRPLLFFRNLQLCRTWFKLCILSSYLHPCECNQKKDLGFWKKLILKLKSKSIYLVFDLIHKSSNQSFFLFIALFHLKLCVFTWKVH